jgi:2-dehydropantoate 2-reductase
MRTAVLGAGSLGTVVGARLAESGRDVTLIDADRTHVAALRENGARIEGQMELLQPVTALLPEEVEGEFALVIYLAKSTYDEVAIPGILPHLGAWSMLLTLQNGIPEEQVASFVGRERTLGGAVGWSAELVGPGVSRLTSDPEKMDYDIGELEGPATARLKAIKEVLDGAGTATMTDNLTGIRWTKLLFNVGGSGVSAALGSRAGPIWDSEKASDTAVLIMVEALLTARALGIKMEPMRGADPAILLDIVKADIANARDLLATLTADMRDSKASMLRDLEDGRPCEVESINGYLEKKATEASVAAPVNEQVARIIREIEAGKLPLDFSNLDLIELPPVSFYLP